MKEKGGEKRLKHCRLDSRLNVAINDLLNK